ncbi:hypothetical protein GJ688_13685 [Heliobacillus mobilis]|uniref:Uncharacterized protein n=1 Tax=Heliobacterium mobile TaxID=28064 RepID=A0A6I3SM26_HELMO|nr:hypothetical protein [Heliobacterium mobile]MTV50023.1 hypothetical protein [Heliobacterium mobile]
MKNHKPQITLFQHFLGALSLLVSGAILGLSFGAWLFLQIRLSRGMKKLIMMRVNYEGKEVLLTNPSSIGEVYDAIVRFFTMKVYPTEKTEKNETRVQIIMGFISAIAILTTLYGIWISIKEAINLIRRR